MISGLLSIASQLSNQNFIKWSILVGSSLVRSSEHLNVRTRGSFAANFSQSPTIINTLFGRIQRAKSKWASFWKEKRVKISYHWDFLKGSSLEYASYRGVQKYESTRGKTMTPRSHTSLLKAPFDYLCIHEVLCVAYRINLSVYLISCFEG